MSDALIIKIKKGLDIPLKALPQKRLNSPEYLSRISLNLENFYDGHFSPLVAEGACVKIGSPLVENKKIPGQYFVSPAGGKVVELRRGEKRTLLDVVIDVAQKESYEEWNTLPPSASREDILAYLLKTGLFAHISSRPFQHLADPKKMPRDIFVKAIETLPFSPPFEMHMEGNALYFDLGLNTLKKLTSGTVFLVYSQMSGEKAFTEAVGVKKVAITGPHPAGSSSVHIHYLAPIKSIDDVVWTLSAYDVIVLGRMMAEGRYYVHKIVGIGGDGIPDHKQGFIKTRSGVAISSLVEKCDGLRLISGDPLTGTIVSHSDFLKFPHFSLTGLMENKSREPLHFLRPGFKKFSFHKAYATGIKRRISATFSFTTHQHGEERPFIDGSVYDKIMPMQIPTMPLIRAILAEDFSTAEELGFLEIVPEDFALSAFICPSKIEMSDIVRRGIKIYSKELEE